MHSNENELVNYDIVVCDGNLPHYVDPELCCSYTSVQYCEHML